jgi:hypothetical protein
LPEVVSYLEAEREGRWIHQILTKLLFVSALVLRVVDEERDVYKTTAARERN